MARLIAAAVAAFVSIGAAAAGAPMTGKLDAAQALARSEAAIGRSVRDQALVGADGMPFQLSDLRGRPLVLSLVYTSCSAVCPVTTQTLRGAVARARAALGNAAFQVLTVGFDARNDTPKRVAAFASAQDIDGDPAWRVASADAAAVEALLADVGFSYVAAAGGFEHVAQTTILDAEGRVYRQVYGDAFPIQVFVEPLKALVYGTSVRSFSPAGLADRLRFLCTVYDPATGGYRTDFAILFGMASGGLSLLVTGFLIFRMWRASSRLRPESVGR